MVHYTQCMPRPRKVTTDEELVPAPRKRVSRPRATTSGSGESTTPRRRVPRVTAPVVEVTSLSRPLRKAPTPVAAALSSRSKRRTQFAIVFGIAVVLSGCGAAIGMSDSGTIDVVASITDRNERINRGEVLDAAGGVVTGTVPVQNTGNVANGGFRAADPSTVVPPPPPPAEAPAASSTESVPETASTTDEVIESDPATNPTDTASTSETAA